MPRKKRGPGHPITTRASEVPRISFSVSKAQYAELEREARTLPKKAGEYVSASIAAKRRAFPEALVLVCTACGLVGVFNNEGKLLPSEVATAKGWWHLGDGRRGRCPDCEAAPPRPPGKPPR